MVIIVSPNSSISNFGPVHIAMITSSFELY